MGTMRMQCDGKYVDNNSDISYYYIVSNDNN